MDPQDDKGIGRLSEKTDKEIAVKQSDADGNGKNEINTKFE